MDLGILLLERHRPISFVTTQLSRAAVVFAGIVVQNMTGYSHAIGGVFDRTPMTTSFYTDRISIMMVGKITDELYEQVRQRTLFEINRAVFESTHA